MSICPICGGEVKPRAANKAHPFCSARCKSIDLGKWLSEEYRVPGPETDDALPSASGASGASGASYGAGADVDLEDVPLRDAKSMRH